MPPGTVLQNLLLQGRLPHPRSLSEQPHAPLILSYCLRQACSVRLWMELGSFILISYFIPNLGHILPLPQLLPDPPSLFYFMLFFSQKNQANKQTKRQKIKQENPNKQKIRKKNNQNKTKSANQTWDAFCVRQLPVAMGSALQCGLHVQWRSTRGNGLFPFPASIHCE